MIAVIEKAVKAILPTPILHLYLDAVAHLQLKNVAKKHFDVGPLQSITSVECYRIFSDTRIAEAWKADHARISSIFGDGDYFGGVNPGDRRALYFLIMALSPINVLEVGTHIGASTMYIASALNRLNQGGQLTTVDIIDVNHPEQGAWKKVGMPESPANFASKLGSLNRIRFHTGSSLQFMRTTNKHFNFIFLDGDHKAKTVYEELSAALPLLQKGGLILLHDYYPGGKPLFTHCVTISGPFDALKRVQKENPLIEVLPLGELPWPTKQGTNMTSLALVTKS
jgi:predicted O-methyltransferase YrrM